MCFIYTDHALPPPLPPHIKRRRVCYTNNIYWPISAVARVATFYSWGQRKVWTSFIGKSAPKIKTLLTGTIEEERNNTEAVYIYSALQMTSPRCKIEIITSCFYFTYFACPVFTFTFFPGFSSWFISSCLWYISYSTNLTEYKKKNLLCWNIHVRVFQKN